MKKRIYFALVLLISTSVICDSKPVRTKNYVIQNNNIIDENLSVTAQQTIIDNIEVTNISVKKTGTTAIKLGDSLQNVIDAFGQPDSIYNYYYEMQEQTASVYLYAGSKFYFLNDKLDAYDISSSVFLVGSPSTDTYFSVGTNLTGLSSLIPNYALNKRELSTYANILSNGIHIDEYILIEYDSVSENITNISTRSY